jgi:hypothetical protein
MAARPLHLRLRLFSAAAALGACVPLGASADEIPRALSNRFRELAQSAERVLATQGPGAAIRTYEDGLLALGDDYGRVHLRLGQLYRQLGVFSEAAQHFRICDGDTRVDAVDREVICREGFDAVTAPVEVGGLREGMKVIVLEPAAFMGPLPAAARLPLGPARFVVESAEGARSEWTVDIAAPMTRFEVPHDALTPEIAGATESSDDTPRGSRWVPWATAGTGLALLATGLTLGFVNRGSLEDVRARQVDGRCGTHHCVGELADLEDRAVLADGLWISGAGVTAVGVGLWFWLD